MQVAALPPPTDAEAAVLRQELVALEAYMADLAKSLKAQGCTTDDMQLPADWSQQVMQASQPGTDQLQRPGNLSQQAMQISGSCKLGSPEQAAQLQQGMQASQAQADAVQMPASLSQDAMQAVQAQIDELQVPAEVSQQADQEQIRSTSPLAPDSCTHDSQPLPGSALVQLNLEHKHPAHGEPPGHATEEAHHQEQTEACAADALDDICSVGDIDAKMVALGWR